MTGSKDSSRRLWPWGAGLIAAALLAGRALAAEPAPVQTDSLPSYDLRESEQAVSEGSEDPLIVLGFAGDLGFSGSGDVPSPHGAIKHGSIIPWAQLKRAVAPLLKADANFANLETVISGSSHLVPIEKSYTFLATPDGLRQAISMGISVVTAANNHAQDFGPDGLLETLSYLAAARGHGLRAYAGIGLGAARYAPGVFQIGSTQVAVAAIGLAVNHAGPEGPGQPLYASPQEYDRVTSSLAATGADIRLLSAHYGQELGSLPDERDRVRFRRTVDSGAAHIVFGHHSHVASGIEYRAGTLILYGLGNFMHSGTQDMSRYGACRDFGLYARVYFWRNRAQPPILRAVEVFPIRGMHAVPEVLPAPQAARRIAIVNALNRVVTGKGDLPLHLEPTSRGSGLACFGDQSIYSDELAARCGVASGPRQVSALVETTLPETCGRVPDSGAGQQVAVNPPPSPVLRPVQKKAKGRAAEKPVKSASAAERPKARSSLLQKLTE